MPSQSVTASYLAFPTGSMWQEMGWPCSQGISIQPQAALSQRRHCRVLPHQHPAPTGLPGTCSLPFSHPSSPGRWRPSPSFTPAGHSTDSYAAVTANQPGTHSLEMGKGSTCRKGRLPPTEGPSGALGRNLEALGGASRCAGEGDGVSFGHLRTASGPSWITPGKHLHASGDTSVLNPEPFIHPVALSHDEEDPLRTP